MKSNLRVMFLAAEADPFIKIGGLGDVAGSLPVALRNQFPPREEGSQAENIDIRLVIPFHGAIQRKGYSFRTIASYTVQSASGPVHAEALETELHGVPVYLITGPLIPLEAPVYTPDASIDGVKFTFFSLAALELARILNWIPHLIHANDWHTAPALYSLYLSRDQDPFYYNTVILLGLHNLPYLGVGAGPALGTFGLPPAVDSSLPSWAQHMPLPLGLLSADHVVTASPTYAREILTPEFGSGLHEFLRSRAGSISGILNGLDQEHWDPRTDPDLAVNYSLDNLAARTANKTTLQKEFALEPDPRQPLFAMITRMDNQKGVDLVPGAFRQLTSRRNRTDKPWQLIILGTGDPALEAEARRLEAEFPAQVRAAIRFDLTLSHRIYAGADALLIPSRYEPCGLTQMIAMRYGCVPVARAVGGLRDTIQDYHESGLRTGFLFKDATASALAKSLLRALQVFSDPADWQALQRNGMAQDFSWNRFARQYFELYKTLVDQRINRAAPQTAGG